MQRLSHLALCPTPIYPLVSKPIIYTAELNILLLTVVFLFFSTVVFLFFSFYFFLLMPDFILMVLYSPNGQWLAGNVGSYNPTSWV